MNKEFKDLMNLRKGSPLVCVSSSHTAQEVEPNIIYAFLEYDESSIPKNSYNANMTWYPDKPIWTADEYEEIRFKFMLIKVKGVDKPVWLKDFKIFIFTE